MALAARPDVAGPCAGAGSGVAAGAGRLPGEFCALHRHGGARGVSSGGPVQRRSGGSGCHGVCRSADSCGSGRRALRHPSLHRPLARHRRRRASGAIDGRHCASRCGPRHSLPQAHPRLSGAAGVGRAPAPHLGGRGGFHQRCGGKHCTGQRPLQKPVARRRCAGAAGPSGGQRRRRLGGSPRGGFAGGGQAARRQSGQRRHSQHRGPRSPGLGLPCGRRVRHAHGGKVFARQRLSPAGGGRQAGGCRPARAPPCDWRRCAHRGAAGGRRQQRPATGRRTRHVLDQNAHRRHCPGAFADSRACPRFGARQGRAGGAAQQRQLVYRWHGHRRDRRGASRGGRPRCGRSPHGGPGHLWCGRGVRKRAAPTRRTKRRHCGSQCRAGFAHAPAAFIWPRATGGRRHH